MLDNRVPRGYQAAVRRVPAGVDGGQHIAQVAGEEVVVFLIGMRVNRWRRVRSWWPPFAAMPRMLEELSEIDAGLLGTHSYRSGRVFLVVQYWRSAAELGAYARHSQMRHAPAWAAFNKHAAGTGDVGIFHETYVVSSEAVESLYGNMPPFGLAAAHGRVPRSMHVLRNQAHREMQTTQADYDDL